MLSMRQKAMDAQGDSFSLYEFYDVIPGNGAILMSIP